MTSTDPAAAGNAAALVGAASTGLKKRSVLLMILLTLVTLGLYYPWWFLRRLTGLNALNTPRRLQLWPFLLLMAFSVLRVAIAIATGQRPIDRAIGSGPAAILSLTGFAIGILIVVQCFFIKDMLEDHLRGSEVTAGSVLSAPTQLSGFLTFFFGAYYLQHIINRDLIGAAASPAP